MISNLKENQKNQFQKKIDSDDLSSQNPKNKLREVSDLYEKQFLREMLKAMKETVHESGFIKTNQAEKIFQEQLDNEYVEKWGDKGGIGLSDMIYKQLLEKYGAQMGLKAPIMKPMGPISLKDSHAFQMKPLSEKDKLSFEIQKKSFPQNSQGSVNSNSTVSPKAEIKSPWKGQLLNSYSFGTEDQCIEVGHENGLKSQLIFKGMRLGLESGQSIDEGEVLGLLSPESKSFYWNLNQQEALSSPEIVSGSEE
jgi:flagellar protein FlgJ